jgi:hypothetical protein
MQKRKWLSKTHAVAMLAGSIWQNYAALFTMLLLVTGAMAFLIKMALPFLHGWNWAAYTLAGIVTASILMLIVTASLAMWRLFHPIPSASVLSTAPPVYRAETLDLDVLVRGLHERVDALAQRADNSAKSFLAYAHLQMMREKVDRIQIIADELTKAPDNDFTDWNAWAARERDWQVALYDWAHIAQFYVKDLTAELGAINQDQYLSSYWGAKVNAINDQDILHKYKTFRLRCVNFNRLSSNATSNAFRIVFDGPPNVAKGPAA